MTSYGLPERLHSALSAIHSTQPRLIAAPPVLYGPNRNGRGKRASVAIILRIRPSASSSSTPSSTSTRRNRQDEHGLDPVASTSSNNNDNTTTSSSPIHQVPPPPFLSSRAHSTASIHSEHGTPLTPTLARLQDFFNLPWVQSGGIPEILYIKRATRSTDRWSAQVAFPGGRQEPEDENSLFTAYRETWEEVGIDLAEKDFLEIGQLDDREITTSLGKRLLMVLSPFVFLHTSPNMPLPDIQTSEVASAHWVPLTCLLAPHVRWGDVCIDITSRISPRSKIIRRILSVLTGNMHFKCILLPNEPVGSVETSPAELDPIATAFERPPLSLWGLTLGMSLDLLSHMSLPQTADVKKLLTADRPYSNELSGDNNIAQSQFFDLSVPPTPHAPYPLLFAPSMTSIFPTFSYPGINFFIWLFGSRYRHLVKRWNDRMSHVSRRSSDSVEASSSSTSKHGGAHRVSESGPSSQNLTRRTSSSHSGPGVNFSAMALNQFYSAVRKALIVAIVTRAVLAFGATSTLAWYLIKYWKERNRRRMSIP